jgi:hypothetical protein
VSISGGTTGWAVGDVVGFTSVADGSITDTKTLTLASGGVIGWAGGLSQAYPAGTVITHGKRTMNAYETVIVDHRGGGDAYAWCARIILEYPALASQSSWLYTSTGGIIGGDMTLATDYVYATGWECQYSDTGSSTTVGKDVCVAGSVNSYSRTNNTAARDMFWIHDLAKCDIYSYIKPIDGIWVAAIKANVGLDLSRSSLTTTGSFNNCAIALANQQKIYFNTSTTYPGTGNGWTANVMGTSYLHHDSDGTSDFMELWCGSYRLRVRSTGSLNFNGSLNTASSISAGSYVNATDEIRVNSTKVVGPRAGTIPDATYGSEAGTINSVLAVMRTHGLISS